MLIGQSYFNPPLFNFGEAVTRTSLLAARPAFELRFFRTQEAILDNLDKDIANIQNAVKTDGLTALLDVRIKALQNDQAFITAFKARTDAKVARVAGTLDNLAAMKALADPGTVAEFDAKLAETIALMETTKTPINERYGLADRLRKAKTDGLAQLRALAHNGFATQADIDDTVAILTDIETKYLASKSLVASNANIAFNLQRGATRTINELSRQVSNIKTAAIDDATDKVKFKQKQAGQLLTALSLAFEASQEFSTYVAKNTVFRREVEPGSILSLFS